MKSQIDLINIGLKFSIKLGIDSSKVEEVNYHHTCMFLSVAIRYFTVIISVIHWYQAVNYQCMSLIWSGKFHIGKYLCKLFHSQDVLIKGDALSPSLLIIYLHFAFGEEHSNRNVLKFSGKLLLVFDAGIYQSEILMLCRKTTKPLDC